MTTFQGSDGNDTFPGPLQNNGGDDILFGRGGNDVLAGGAASDWIDGGTGADILDGGSGVDTVSYLNSAAGVTVVLGTATISGGDAQGDTLGHFENVSGSQFDDILGGDGGANTLSGQDGNDTLEGGAGADTLDGGDGGVDTVSYAHSSAGVTVALGSPLIQGGDANGDTLRNFENVTGSQHDDTLGGDGGANTLLGLDGNDDLRGGAGADFLDGGAGIDTVDYLDSAAGVTIILGTSTTTGGDARGDALRNFENVTGSQHDDTLGGDGGANTLLGLGGNDVLRGGAGADFLDGGAGIDTVSYFTGSTGVTVILGTSATGGGDANGDILRDFENVSGSQGNDILGGDGGANTLQGWNGNDMLTGGGGKDTLTGGVGADRFVYAGIADSVVGTNADRITDFSHAQADRIDLSAIDASTGAAGDQAFHFIGTGAYTHHAGELRYAVKGADTTIAGDVNGDGTSDFHIVLTGHIALAAGDFIL